MLERANRAAKHESMVAGYERGVVIGHQLIEGDQSLQILDGSASADTAFGTD